MTEIEVTPTALDYIRSHGNNATVLFGYRSGCCGGRVQVPSVFAGVPDDPTQYQQFSVEDCSIWLPSDLETKGVTIDLAKLWVFAKLVIQVKDT